MPNAYYLVRKANRAHPSGLASSAGGQAFCQTSRPGSPVRLWYFSRSSKIKSATSALTTTTLRKPRRYLPIESNSNKKVPVTATLTVYGFSQLNSIKLLNQYQQDVVTA